MKFEWPENIIIQFVTENNNAPISGLVVHCILLSRIKNNFSLEPLKTNSDGLIEISKKQSIAIIEKTEEEYPMDYSGDLSDCFGIKIEVEDKNGLEKRLYILQEFYPIEAIKLKSIIENSSNFKFKKFEKSYNLPFKKEFIVIKL